MSAHLTREAAEEFVTTWIAAWNRHDLDAVMAMCADDVVFESTFLIDMFDTPSGILRGKDELRRWFAANMAPGEIHIDDPIHVLVGLDSVVLVESISGTVAANVFTLHDGKITRSVVHG